MNNDDVMLLFQQGIAEKFADLLAKAFFDEKERREKVQPEQRCPWEVGQELECISDGGVCGERATVLAAKPFCVKWEGGMQSDPGAWRPSDFKAVDPKPTHRFKVGDVITRLGGSGIEYKITALRDGSDEYGAVSNHGIQYKWGHFKSDKWHVVRHEPPSDPAPQWQAGDVVLSADGNACTLQRKDREVWHVTYCGPNQRHGYGLAAESIFTKRLHRPSDSAEAKS